MKNEKSDSVDIMLDIKIKSKRKILDVTINKWIRNCPQCKIELKYKSNTSYKNACRKNSICRDCGYNSDKKYAWNLKHTITQRNCPKCNNIINYPTGNICYKAAQKNRTCRSCAPTALKWPQHKSEWKKSCPICNKLQQYRYLKSYKSAFLLNKPCIKCAIQKVCNSDKIRESRRNARLNKITPNFNQNACVYFDNLSNERDWKLQQALNGGEVKCIGYSLDAYDKEKNIVVEYDEPHHYQKGKLKKKDIKRQRNIIEYLKCKFFRYKVSDDILYQITM